MWESALLWALAPGSSFPHAASGGSGPRSALSPVAIVHTRSAAKGYELVLPFV